MKITKSEIKIAVTSSSFSKSVQLRNELKEHSFKSVVFNDTGMTLSGKELDFFLKDSNVAIIGLEECGESFFERNRQIRVISKYGVGLNNIDFDSAKRYGVKILYSQGVNRRSVSELVLAFILGSARNVFNSIEKMRDGIWDKNGGYELSGRVVGIIGFGNIGRDLAGLLKPFNITCLVNDICNFEEVTTSYSVKNVDLDFLLRNSDVITLHVPYSETTQDLISKRELELIKEGSLIINTSRGGIVNEQFLLEKLNRTKYFCAALDTFIKEPQISSDLVNHPRVFCTPHIGGNSREAIQAMGGAAIKNLINFIDSND
jgi:phosphoglycerate dehydrogenase-like enzyme